MVRNEVELKVSVHYWQFQTGEPEPVPESLKKVYPTGYREGAPKGWFCWAYPSDDRAFEEWMHRCCPTADITHRFNSGDPMYTVRIPSDKEAILFQLAWVK